MKKILVLAALAVGLVGCGQKYDDQHGVGDAPVQNKKGDDAPAVVINFPDGYENVAIKCFHGNGLYTTTRDAAPVVVVHDPNCDGNVVRLTP